MNLKISLSKSLSKVWSCGEGRWGGGEPTLLLKVRRFNEDITKIMPLLHQHKAGKQHFYFIPWIILWIKCMCSMHCHINE